MQLWISISVNQWSFIMLSHVFDFIFEIFFSFGYYVFLLGKNKIIKLEQIFSLLINYFYTLFSLGGSNLSRASDTNMHNHLIFFFPLDSSQWRNYLRAEGGHHPHPPLPSFEKKKFISIYKHTHTHTHTQNFWLKILYNWPPSPKKFTS